MTMGDRTMIMADTTPTYSPQTSNATAATTGRVLTTEMGSQEVDRFRYRRQLSQGGMGEILEVEQTIFGRSVALKTLRHDRRDHALAEAFQAEVRITAGLEHPGVAPVHDAGVDYLVMKLVEGSTLGQLLAERQDLDHNLADLVEILLRVSDCLGYAHQRGILHRDLKPANIMVGAYGEVYLMDWGLALAYGDSRSSDQLPHISTARNICAGSPAYLPPEVATGRRDLMGPASDVFGLGAILFEILTGEQPFTGRTVNQVLQQAARNQHQAIPEAIAKRHPELTDLCTRMLVTDPAQRPAIAVCQRDIHAWLEVSGRRAAAREHHATARRCFEQACLATHSGTIYHLLAECAKECERTLALDPGSDGTRQLRSDAHRRYAEEAIRVGDLVLAQAVLDEDDEDPLLDPLRSQVAAGFESRARRSRRTRLARRLAVRLSIAVVILL